MEKIEVNEVKKPHGIPIIIPDKEEKNYQLDTEAFSKLISDNGVENLPVVLLSVAGAFRKGKSFLLNLFVRYLSSKDKENWLGDEDEPLVGFRWRGGCDRETTGIILWSEIFKIKRDDGSEVAVMLMDTQGAFDGESSIRECITIFALSTMVSSIQIYNLSQHIQENDLQHLELFIEYGRLALENSECKPFQSLKFLIRDWSYPYEYPYGKEGGRKLLDKKLDVCEDQSEEIKKVRTNIKLCFEELSCYLLPHPGLNVATNPNFNGCLKEIQSVFKDHIKLLVPLLFAPENLKVKRINGADICCGELLSHFTSYMNVFNDDKLPEPQSVLNATADLSNINLSNKCLCTYTDRMDKLCKNHNGYLQPKQMERLHQESMDKALNEFDNKRKLGGEKMSKKYREELEENVNKSFQEYIEINDQRKSLFAFLSPIVLGILGLITYLASGFFNFFGGVNLSFAIYLVFITLVFFLFPFWCLTQTTGLYFEFGNFINQICELVWNQCFVPSFRLAVNFAIRKYSKSLQVREIPS